jgi:cardiolipin synthase A/B
VKKAKRNKQLTYSANKVRLIRGGHQYFDLIIQLIKHATDAVHLQTYIFEADETGKKVANALIHAAKRNIKVYLLVDGFASQSLDDDFIQKLTDAGIHFRQFEPLFKSRHFYFGRRLHSKVLVVDSRYALVGGVNITNRYNDMPGAPAWLDFALFAEGPVAVEACRICVELWKGFRSRDNLPSCDDKPASFQFNEKESSMVRLRRNDWVRNRLQISNSYLKMFRTATSHITILSSYALPGNVFRKNLVRAIRRGVKVRMIVSAESDVLLVKHAERYWYDWLIRNKIEIYEYHKNVLHGKLAIFDNEWMTIGSYNINDLSAYASVELNFDVLDNNFVPQVEDTLQQIIDNDCRKVSKENLAKHTGIWNRIVQWFAYYIIRLTLSLFTFYYRKQK